MEAKRTASSRHLEGIKKRPRRPSADVILSSSPATSDLFEDDLSVDVLGNTCADDLDDKEPRAGTSFGSPSTSDLFTEQVSDRDEGSTLNTSDIFESLEYASDSQEGSPSCFIPLCSNDGQTSDEDDMREDEFGCAPLEESDKDEEEPSASGTLTCDLLKRFYEARLL